MLSPSHSTFTVRSPSWKLLALLSTLLVLFGACGAQVIGELMRDAGEVLADSGTAHAQRPSTCRQWEVQRLFCESGSAATNRTTATSNFAGQAISIPEGRQFVGGPGVPARAPVRAVRRGEKISA